MTSAAHIITATDRSNVKLQRYVARKKVPAPVATSASIYDPRTAKTLLSAGIDRVVQDDYEIMQLIKRSTNLCNLPRLFAQLDACSDGRMFGFTINKPNGSRARGSFFWLTPLYDDFDGLRLMQVRIEKGQPFLFETCVRVSAHALLRVAQRGTHTTDLNTNIDHLTSMVMAILVKYATKKNADMRQAGYCGAVAGWGDVGFFEVFEGARLTVTLKTYMAADQVKHPELKPFAHDSKFHFFDDVEVSIN